ncbi:MAG TPA: phytanoyl-CoA dioxygenase family protein [Acidimicrobiales bacterium]|jgi:ectoine hydroxylase-related dioxygenase (phytanoyl-CoA dioxygenase family)
MNSPLDRHPWNHGFVAGVPETPATTVSENDRQAFVRDGYLVVQNVLEPGLLAELTGELDAVEAGVDQFLGTQEGGRFTIAEQGAITFSPHIVLTSAVARAVARHHTLLGLCRDLLGPDVNLYWDQAVYKKTEKPRRFPWHQDNGYTYVEPQGYLTCWLALTDATVDNGCPWVIPGAHREGTLRHRWVDPIGWECFEDPAGARPAPVAAGGAVVFSSVTPHLTGPNTTDAVRKAYIVQYAVDGTERLEGDPDAGAPDGRTRQDDPDRQFPVLRHGEAIPA